MLLLLADSSLLTFITLTLGVLARESLSRLFRSPVNAGLLELFLLGLIMSSLYFNILSFWLPVDYRTLLPPALLGLAGNIFYKEKFRGVWASIRDNLVLFFSPSQRPLTFAVGIVLLAYWILPCGTPDSILYHCQSILWYEKYKVVPGLANLNARFAFNPASFIIGSAYSFTGPVGQSLYPLNGVASLVFFGWLLRRLLLAARSPASLIYATLIVLAYKALLIDIGSPSSDGLSLICIFYVLIGVSERSLAADSSLAANIVPALVILYAVTVKTTSFALLPVLFYMFYQLPRQQKKTGLVGKILTIGLIIYLPWIGRNYILSGYPVFPFPFANWFRPDWAAPAGLAQMEYNLIHLTPKVEGLTDDPFTNPQPTRLWMIPWMMFSLKQRTMDVLLFILALLSPLYWLIRPRWKKSRSPLFVLWLIIYAATWLWFMASPVFRYGRPYVCMAFLLPVFDLIQGPWRRPSLRNSHRSVSSFFPRIILTALVLSGTFYLVKGFYRPTTYTFTLADCWLTPLKSIWHDEKQKEDFPYYLLKNGVRLYMADAKHQCVNACLPCMQWNYGEVEMRGTRIDQGFRNTRYRFGGFPVPVLPTPEK